MAIIGTIGSSFYLFDSEADYRDKWCGTARGQAEYTLEDRTRVDCLTDKYAVEVDYAPKWAEAIGQSLHYGIMTKRIPGIVIIVEDEKECKHVDKIKRLRTIFKLPIKMWIVGVGC
jgi:hypothetical protein